MIRIARADSVALAGGLAASVALAWAATAADAQVVVAGAVAVAAIVAVLRRPAFGIAAVAAGLLADGRVISHFHFGPVFVVDAVLVLLLGATFVRTSAAARAGPQAAMLRSWAVLFVPALAAIALKTNGAPSTWIRYVALVEYPLFAYVAASLLPTMRLYRMLAHAVVLGSVAAFALVLSHHAGEDQDIATSTGAVRLAHGSFSLPFGIATLVLLAGVSAGVMPRSRLLLVPPLLYGLVAINHRSAWIAFVIAASLMLALHMTARRLVVASAVAVLATVILSSSVATVPTVRAELQRARTVADSSDPNAQFRLLFWQRALGRAVASPVIGNGFDPYPAELIPRETYRDAAPQPHNSFVNLAYRVGLIPTLIVLVLIFRVLMDTARQSRTTRDPRSRAVGSALVGSAVYIGIFASFNVVLEVPYMAPLFWIAVGLAAAFASNGIRESA